MNSFRLITLLVFAFFLSFLVKAQEINPVKPDGRDRFPVSGNGVNYACPGIRMYGLCDHFHIDQDVVVGLNAKINWRNTVSRFPERYSYSGWKGTDSNNQQFVLLASSGFWDGDFPNPHVEKPAFSHLSRSEYLFMPLVLPEGQKVIFNQKAKAWKPDAQTAIIGAVFAGIGAAVVLTRPFPDINSDKVGPLLVYILGASSAAVGTVAMFTGILHRAKVNQQPYDPGVASGQMTLISTTENNKALSAVSGILEKGGIRIHDKANNVQGIPKQVKVFDDRIEITAGNQKSTLGFKDLYICGITTFDGFPKVFEAGYIEFKLVEKNNYRQLEDLKNNLNFIRNQFEIQAKTSVLNDRLNAFKPLAAKYRAMETAPTMSENQRKLIVQANVFTDKMQYDQAINMLNQALTIDPVAYPAAYTNLAVLYARIKKYDEAILNMKKYLLLVPDAADARDSQDKIYEWELLQKK
jgi:hypothetical protein